MFWKTLLMETHNNLLLSSFSCHCFVFTSQIQFTSRTDLRADDNEQNIFNFCPKLSFCISKKDKKTSTWGLVYTDCII